MGRIKSITPLVRKGSHFTYEERIQLEFYLSGTGKLPKVTNKVMLGTLLQKSPWTIAREIQRGQVEHYLDEGLQTKMVYNADYTEHKARDKDSGKGPQLKLGYDFTLAQAIWELIREKKYSPFAVLAHFNNTGRPTETRICEKTLYNYIYEGLIPNVSEKNLLLQGKGRKTIECKWNHRNALLAKKSIIYRPKDVSTREEFGHWEGDTIIGGKGKGSECILTMVQSFKMLQELRNHLLGKEIEQLSILLILIVLVKEVQMKDIME